MADELNSIESDVRDRSWLSSSLLIAYWGILTGLFLFVMPKFEEIYQDFDVELPGVSAWTVSAPPSIWLVMFLGILAAVVGKQFYIRGAETRFWVNVVLWSLSVIVTAFAVITLFVPMIKLIEGVSRP